jgi:hypothetical protein
MQVGESCAAVTLAFLAGVGAYAQGIRVIAVEPTVATIPQAAVNLLTTVTPAAPTEATPFSVVWTSAPDDPSEINLNLRLIPSASFVGGRAQWVLLSVKGTLTRATADGTSTWAVEQSNFGSTIAHGEYTKESSKLSLLLPVGFTLQEAPGASAVHALLLVPCHLQGNHLSCEAPRFAFDGLVRRQFPKEPTPEDVLPSRLQSVEGIVPAPKKNGGVLPAGGVPPSQMACCLDDSGIIGLCFMACKVGCQTSCPGICDSCYDFDCVNCAELDCKSCL